MIRDPETDKAEQLRIRNEQAPIYDNLLREKGKYYSTIELDYSIRGLKLKPTDILFDAGCGTGRLTVMLAGKVEKIICCDFSEKSIEILKSKVASKRIKNITPFLADLTEPINYPDKYFTKIYSNNVLPFIAPKDQVSLLKEFWRLLQPNGILCLAMLYRLEGPLAKNVKEGYFESSSSKLYRYAFNAEDLKEKLAVSGFTNIKTEGLISLPFRLGSLIENFGFSTLLDRSVSAFTKRTWYIGATATKRLH